MNAEKLAAKVKKIIDKHIRGNGYEIEVSLLTPANTALNRDQLNVEDTGQPDPHSETIKIVVTAHKTEERLTELGDRTIEILHFIVIEDGTEPDLTQVKEGRSLIYLGKQFNIKLAAPATLAGQLIVKECEAERIGV